MLRTKRFNLWQITKVWLILDGVVSITLPLLPKSGKSRLWKFEKFSSSREHFFHELAKRKRSEIVGGYLMRDHVHICVRIPPEYSVSRIVSYVKGSCVIAIARHFKGKQRAFSGEYFWVQGYFVSIVEPDQNVAREFSRNQEKNDETRAQLKLGFDSRPGVQ
ncbi:IS200/IS605 family transposase [Endozoicomonas sp. ISHI1]|uniref:IS200/IS605 family transposase n=1 Tax=Endozoicomonas sp. ISHI1 TaxID=2825882 RepID=UPI00359FDCB7